MTFSVTVLGTSSALPTASRGLTAHVLNVYERFFLIDCGEGTVRQLRRYKISFAKIDHLFISHLHGDHYFGIFGLLRSFALLGRNKDFHIYAHQELQDIINCQFVQENLSYNIVFHALKKNQTEQIYENKQITVTTFPLKHRVVTNGFLFQEKEKLRNVKKDLIPYYNLSIKDIVNIKQGADFVNEDGKIVPNKHLTTDPPKPRSYAFCSDTAFFPKIVPIIKNVNLLYHESTFTTEKILRAKETLHSTTHDAAEIAKLANAKKLIIGHFSARYNDLSIFEKEASEVFKNVELAKDGKTYVIEH